MPINSILDVFSKSPLKPLIEHIDKVKTCSHVLIPFFDAVFRQDWEAAQEHRLKICHLENEADTLKHKIRMRLPSGIFMPVERSDMLELLSQQDNIANRCKDLSGQVIGRNLLIPQVIQADFLPYTQRNIDAIDQAHMIINELSNLLESGFHGKEVELVLQMISELETIEDDTDSLQITLRQQLFAIEANLNPVDIIFLYKIIESIGGLADLSKRVGSRLEIMLVQA
jgi:uncharacterized protein